MKKIFATVATLLVTSNAYSLDVEMNDSSISIRTNEVGESVSIDNSSNVNNNNNSSQSIVIIDEEIDSVDIDQDDNDDEDSLDVEMENFMD